MRIFLNLFLKNFISFLLKSAVIQPDLIKFSPFSLSPLLIKASPKTILPKPLKGGCLSNHSIIEFGDKFLAHIERCKILLHLVDSSDPNWKENYYVIRKELEKYGQNLSQKEEVVALSKEDLNPEMTNKVIKEMTKLNKNKKFSISSFNNNGVEDLTSYLFKKCEIEDDQ